MRRAPGGLACLDVARAAGRPLSLFSSDGDNSTLCRFLAGTGSAIFLFSARTDLEPWPSFEVALVLIGVGVTLLMLAFMRFLGGVGVSGFREAVACLMVLRATGGMILRAGEDTGVNCCPPAHLFAGLTLPGDELGAHHLPCDSRSANSMWAVFPRSSSASSSVSSSLSPYAIP